MPGRIKTVSHEFEFDKSRTLIVSEKPCGVGNNCIAYKCTVLFNEEDSEFDEKKNCKKDGESDKKKTEFQAYCVNLHHPITMFLNYLDTKMKCIDISRQIQLSKKDLMIM